MKVAISTPAYRIPTTRGIFKEALSGPRQFLASENPLKMIKNAFYYTLEALFVLKIFQFLS